MDRARAAAAGRRTHVAGGFIFGSCTCRDCSASTTIELFEKDYTIDTTGEWYISMQTVQHHSPMFPTCPETFVSLFPCWRTTFSAGLVKFAVICDVKEKWKAIAGHVGTRDLRACADRFKAWWARWEPTSIVSDTVIRQYRMTVGRCTKYYDALNLKSFLFLFETTTTRIYDLWNR